MQHVCDCLYEMNILFNECGYFAVAAYNDGDDSNDDDNDFLFVYLLSTFNHNTCYAGISEKYTHIMYCLYVGITIHNINVGIGTVARIE